MKKEIAVNVLDHAGGRFAVNGFGTIKEARLEAKRIIDSLGLKSTVEVVYDGLVKRVYGSLENRREMLNYIPSSAVLHGKS